MKSTTSKILLGFIAGAAVGAALGILLAPDKGSETRSRLRQKIQDLEEKLKGEINSLEDDSVRTED